LNFIAMSNPRIPPERQPIGFRETSPRYGLLARH
jgi:hypothetical protein